MAQTLNKLSPRAVETATGPVRLSDGGGLYLVVEKSGARRWEFHYRFEGKRYELGLGGFTKLPQKDARIKAAAYRKMLGDRKNPKSERDALTAIPTFGEMADDMLVKVAGLSKAQLNAWKRALDVYAAPIRPIRVDKITTDDILTVLNQRVEDADGKATTLWKALPETASRLRGRIETVLNAARARGYRREANPALWRGHLDHLLEKPKLGRGHHAALPYAEMSAFVGRLRQREATAALALEFTILTAARTGEVIGATWGEIDLLKKVWSIPEDRMKARQDHRVALSGRAVEILEALWAVIAQSKAKIEPGSRFVFAGHGTNEPLSTNAMRALLLRMKRPDITIHGFRSTFRDWAGEVSTFPREVAEAALAHAVGDATERAYRRGDALEKRRKLMQAWANYIEPKPAQKSGDNVSQFRKVG